MCQMCQHGTIARYKARSVQYAPVCATKDEERSQIHIDYFRKDTQKLTVTAASQERGCGTQDLGCQSCLLLYVLVDFEYHMQTLLLEQETILKAKQNSPYNASTVWASNESTSSLGPNLLLMPPLLTQVTPRHLPLLDLLLLCSLSVLICTPLGLCTYILKVITAPITEFFFLRIQRDETQCL